LWRAKFDKIEAIGNFQLLSSSSFNSMPLEKAALIDNKNGRDHSSEDKKERPERSSVVNTSAGRASVASPVFEVLQDEDGKVALTEVAHPDIPGWVKRLAAQLPS